MTERSQYGNLQVAKELDKLLIEEILPGLNISEEEFWNSFNHIVEEFVPRNKSLINDREELAEQSVEELTSIMDITDEHAGELIMKARAHWFD